MNGVGVFLTLAEIDCCSDRGREQLGEAVRYLRTVWLAFFPARAVPMKLRKLLLRCSADFQVRRAIGLPKMYCATNGKPPPFFLAGYGS